MAAGKENPPCKWLIQICYDASIHRGFTFVKYKLTKNVNLFIFSVNHGFAVARMQQQKRLQH